MLDHNLEFPLKLNIDLKGFFNIKICLYLFKMFHKKLMLEYGFPCGSAGKESTCNAGDLGLIPGLGRSPGEKGKASHSSILAWKIPWTVHSPWGCKELDTTE